QTRARIVLLAPPPQEDLGRPLPDPASHNRDLALYRDALRETAQKHGYLFVDLYELLRGEMDQAKEHLTDNGIHLTAYGYWRSAQALERDLGLGNPSSSSEELPAAIRTGKTIAFALRTLSPPLPPGRFASTNSEGTVERWLHVPGLPD